MPTESNFLRRGTVADSVLGGFGMIDIASQKESSLKIAGNSSKGFAPIKTFHQSSRKSGSEKNYSKLMIQPADQSYLSSRKEDDSDDSLDGTQISNDSYTKK